MPGIGLGDVAADDGAQRGRQHGKGTCHGRGENAPSHGKQKEACGEHGRDHDTAAITLDRPKQNQRLELVAHGAAEAGSREASHGADEQAAQREQPGQGRRQGNGNDLGNQIGRLDPAQPIERNTEGCLDLGQRTGNDLDVQDRHEHAQTHGKEAQPSGKPATALRRRHRCRAAAATGIGRRFSAVDGAALEGWDKLFLRESGCEAIWRKSSSGRNHDSATASIAPPPNWISQTPAVKLTSAGKLNFIKRLNQAFTIQSLTLNLV